MMKSKKWIAVSIVIAALIAAVVLFPFAEIYPHNDPLITTTTTAATTATIKDEPLATTTGTEMTGAFTTLNTTTSSSKETETTTQGGSASVTKTTASKSTKTTASKTKATKTTTATQVTAGKQSYLDTSKLTYTQEDVGKVVGYNSSLKQDVTVVKVKEGVDSYGLKYIKTYFSDGTGSCVGECMYCHEFPCPDGGGEACSEYDAKLDGTKTCQQCGCPYGDGYNGTCDAIIDWANGGKIICNHYD